MTIRQDLFFTYDGIRSTQMGLYNVSIQSGLFSEKFVADREIIEESIMGRDEPYFYGIKRQPLEFQLSFYFDNKWDDKTIEEVALWLSQDKYKPLIFNNHPHKIFYCLPVSDFSIIHNGIKQGYLTLTMRCKSPYIYTPEYNSPIYDFSLNTVDGMDFTFENKGHVNCKPIIHINKIGIGDISIVNLSDEGKEFKFTGLADNETITVNNETEEIETDLTGIYRYNNFNMKFLSLPRGVNRLKAYGNCKIMFKSYFKLLH